MFIGKERLLLCSSYTRVKGRSHTVEERISIHSHKPHATSIARLVGLCLSGCRFMSFEAMPVLRCFLRVIRDEIYTYATFQVLAFVNSTINCVRHGVPPVRIAQQPIRRPNR